MVVVGNPIGERIGRPPPKVGILAEVFGNMLSGQVVPVAVAPELIFLHAEIVAFIQAPRGIYEGGSGDGGSRCRGHSSVSARRAQSRYPSKAAKKVCSDRLGVDVAAAANTFLAHAYDECVGVGVVRGSYSTFSRWIPSSSSPRDASSPSFSSFPPAPPIVFSFKSWSRMVVWRKDGMFVVSRRKNW
jgi:hypothetical protein